MRVKKKLKRIKIVEYKAVALIIIQKCNFRFRILINPEIINLNCFAEF